MSTRGSNQQLELLQGTLDLLILQTLAFGRAHGHAIARSIELKSDEVFRVGHGSLYPAFQRLLKLKLITAEDGISYKIYNGYWFFGRPTLEDLRQDARVVTRKCRPDWDITTPEMKAAWKEGRKELFYPYGKTYAQTLGEQD